MSSNQYQTPDLATILKTLASLPPASQRQQSTSIPAPHLPNYPPQQDHTQQQAAWQPQPQSQTPPVASKNLVDPATIVDWSSGLRCIMKTAAKHENMLNDIRKMIKVQHEHEEQWWKGREELVKRQQAREETQKKLDEVLRAVGGAVSTGNTNVTPEELARELETFDMKVHRAQMQMVKEMTARFRNLGVPFFGTRLELVIASGKEDRGDGTGGRKLESGMILEADLMDLQRKMLAMLEDLCNEAEDAGSGEK